MVKDEYNGLQYTLKASPSVKKLMQLRYKLSNSTFLFKRDQFIATTIDTTLGENETEILFIGAYYKVMKRLLKNITVIVLKNIFKIRNTKKPFNSILKQASDNMNCLNNKWLKNESSCPVN